VQCSRQQAQKSKPRTSSPQQSDVITSIILISTLPFLFSYIDIIQVILEIASKIFGFLCQEILTKLFVFAALFGMIFAGAYLLGSRKTCRKSFAHKGLRQKTGAGFSVSPYAVRVYV
jgi:hypothetical protein